MAYGDLYRRKTTNKWGEEVKIVIKEDGYSGAVSDINFSDTPAVLKMHGKDDSPFDPIKTFELRLELITDNYGDYDDLFEGSVKKYIAYYYLDDVIKWYGYIQPKMCEHTYCANRYVNTIVATDGIGLLQDIEFKESDGDFYTGKKLLIQIIDICLKKLYSSVTYREAFDINETSDSVSGLAVLGLYSLDTAMFRKDEKTAWNCYDVLETIMEAFNCQIKFWNGYFYIGHVTHIVKSSVSYKEYISMGSPSSSSYSPQMNITNASGDPLNVPINKSVIISKLDAWKALKTTQDLGLKKDLLYPIIDFSVGISGSLSEEFSEENKIFRFWGNTISGSGNYGYIRSRRPIEYSNSQNLDIDFKLSTLVFLGADLAGQIGSGNIDIIVNLYVQSGGTKYYMYRDGSWHTAYDHEAELFWAYRDGVTKLDYKYSSQLLPPVEGYLYLLIGIANTNAQNFIISLNLDDIKINLAPADLYIAQEFDEEIITETNINNDNFTIEERTVQIGDAVSCDNNELLYLNNLWRNSGNDLTDGWEINGGGEDLSLTELMDAERISIFRNPVVKLSGSLLCHFDPLTSPQANSISFLIHSGEWDLKKSIFIGVLLSVTEQDAFYLVTEDGQEIITETTEENIIPES